MIAICTECGNHMSVIDDVKFFFVECKSCINPAVVKASSFVTAKFIQEWA